MTGRILNLIRLGSLAALAACILTGSNSVLAVTGSSRQVSQNSPSKGPAPQAQPVTSCQPTPTQPPAPGPSGTTAAASQGQGRGGPGRGGPGGPGNLGTCWWRDDALKREIGIRDDQIRKMDGLYERRAKDMAPFLQELTKEQEVLQQMTRERVVEDNVFAAQIAKVSSLDQRIRDSRSLMNYRAYRLLDAEQYQKLLAYFDKLRGGRGRGGLFRP